MSTRRAHIAIKYSTACFSQQPFRRREDAVIDLGSELRRWATTFDADNMFTVSWGFRAPDGRFEKDFAGDMYAGVCVFVCSTQGASECFRVHCMRTRNNMHFATEKCWHSRIAQRCANNGSFARLHILFSSRKNDIYLYFLVFTANTFISFLLFFLFSVIDVFTCDKINVCS